MLDVVLDRVGIDRGESSSTQEIKEENVCYLVVSHHSASLALLTYCSRDASASCQAPRFDI